MGFFYYHIKVKCNNCGKVCNISIKRGTTVIEAIKNRQIKCNECGCQITPTEYSTEWLK